jgi:FixJ family two-component response regulator
MSATTPYIAIVDDDASVRTALSRLLNASAFMSRTYSSALEFLESLTNSPPECLVVDFQMPEMNGFELCEELVRAGVQIPTIVITAQDDSRCRERCRAVGAPYLLKPLDQAILIEAIDRAIGRSRCVESRPD